MQTNIPTVEKTQMMPTIQRSSRYVEVLHLSPFLLADKFDVLNGMKLPKRISIRTINMKQS